MGVLQRDVYEINKQVEHEKQLDKDQHRPIELDHVERELNEHATNWHSREKVVEYFLVGASVDEEISRSVHSAPIREEQEETDAKNRCINRNEPLPKVPWLLILIIFSIFYLRVPTEVKYDWY